MSQAEKYRELAEAELEQANHYERIARRIDGWNEFWEDCVDCRSVAKRYLKLAELLGETR